jgi:hypothetical protein
VLSGKRKWVAAGLVVGLLLITVAGAYGYRRWQRLQESQPRPLPKNAVVVPAATAPPSPEPTAVAVATPPPPPTPVTGTRVLAVPYSGQAPFSNWDPQHEEFCEAATVLMVAYWYQHRYVGTDVQQIPPAEADNVMKNQIVPWERHAFPYLDLPLADVAKVGAGFDPSLTGTVMPIDPEVIRQNLAANRPVIIPVMTQLANGDKLEKHYTSHRGAQGGYGVYHLLVLIGYNTASNSFFADDPGIVPEGRRIEYSWPSLSSFIDAQTSSPDTKVRQGRVMLVFSKQG